MGEVAWINLRIWPWNDEWLDQDAGLHEAFRDVDLAVFGGMGKPILSSAMNGSIDTFEPWGGVQIDGEMRGGSYEIREESDLLETLQDRGIAYLLIGDAKYEWDGDETFWHPGMAEPFHALHTEGAGRVLGEHTFRALLDAGAPIEERIEKRRRQLSGVLAAISDFEESGTADPPPYLLAAEQAHRQEIARLERERPEPEDTLRAITDYFAASFEWAPPAGYTPKLKTEQAVTGG